MHQVQLVAINVITKQPVGTCAAKTSLCNKLSAKDAEPTLPTMPINWWEMWFQAEVTKT